MAMSLNARPQARIAPIHDLCKMAAQRLSQRPHDKRQSRQAVNQDHRVLLCILFASTFHSEFSSPPAVYYLDLLIGPARARAVASGHRLRHDDAPSQLIKPANQSSAK